MFGKRLGKTPAVPAYDDRFTPHHHPRHLTLSRKTAGGLPEYGVIGTSSAAWVASARMAAMIERFEPGWFNFIPFTVVPASGSPKLDYCLRQPAEFLHAETVLLDRSGYQTATAPDERTYRSQPGCAEQPPQILDAAKVEDRHWLTTGNRGTPSHRVLSDDPKPAPGDLLPPCLTPVEAQAVPR